MNMANSKSYTCQIVGLIIAAIIVGVLSYFVGMVAPLWVAIIAFLIFLAVGYWLVSKFCALKVDESPVAAARPASVEVEEPVAVAEPAPVAEPEPVAEVAASDKNTPELLSEPRGGAGDDLKKIKGVGPKFESDLNAKGIWHYDQIANWTAQEVAWADDNLGRFKGRISRDDWVGQAKILATGGDTDFSKKVDKGDVY